MSDYWVKNRVKVKAWCILEEPAPEWLIKAFDSTKAELIQKPCFISGEPHFPSDAAEIATGNGRIECKRGDYLVMGFHGDIHVYENHLFGEYFQRERTD